MPYFRSDFRTFTAQRQKNISLRQLFDQRHFWKETHKRSFIVTSSDFNKLSSLFFNFYIRYYLERLIDDITRPRIGRSGR